MSGEKYCGKINSKEVHNLDNEQAVCQIDKITLAGHDRPFNQLPHAHREGYDNCNWCLGN